MIGVDESDKLSLPNVKALFLIQRVYFAKVLLLCVYITYLCLFMVLQYLSWENISNPWIKPDQVSPAKLNHLNIAYIIDTY